MLSSSMSDKRAVRRAQHARTHTQDRMKSAEILQKRIPTDFQFKQVVTQTTGNVLAIGQRNNDC